MTVKKASVNTKQFAWSEYLLEIRDIHNRNLNLLELSEGFFWQYKIAITCSFFQSQEGTFRT